ncbi:MAG: rhomboid family intramembrane serine protease [Gammaproteobacteria bacterium]
MFPLHDDNPTRIVPVVTVTIIVTCVLVFIWQISLGQQFERAIYSFGAIPSVVFGIKALPAELEIVPPWTTVLTSMFMHGGWMHLIGNMLYFWIFGNNVEDAMGHVRFVIFYMLCGIAAFLAQSLPAPQSVIPMVGASGAISGVLGAYLLLYPHARVLVAIPLGFFIYTTRLAAGWVLAFWFVLQIISSALTGAGEGGVAFGAHIGGFVAGMVLIPLFKYKTYPLFAPPRS